MICYCSSNTGKMGSAFKETQLAVCVSWGVTNALLQSCIEHTLLENAWHATNVPGLHNKKVCLPQLTTHISYDIIAMM